MMQTKSLVYLLVVALIILGGVAFVLPKQASAPANHSEETATTTLVVIEKQPAEPAPTGQLRIDVTFVKTDPATKQKNAVPNVSLKTASLACPKVDAPASETANFPAWYTGSGWCNKRSGSAPANADANGSITLWFLVSPAPDKAELGQKIGGVGGPSLHIQYENGPTMSYNPTRVTPSHWKLVAEVPASN